MLLGIMAISAFFESFIVVAKLLLFPFTAVAETGTGRRIINKVSGAFGSEGE